MKKLLTMILILALLVPFSALADLPSLDGLSFDELVELREQLNLAIWNSKEWKEVTVPIGPWKVGEDIPAGTWTISVPSDDPDQRTYIEYCDTLEPGGVDGDVINSKIFYCQWLRSKTSDDEYYPDRIDLQVFDGMYVVVMYGPALFTPYAGKPDLGF